MNCDDGMRDRFVAEQIAARGIKDPAVLSAMRTVPREMFVPAEFKARAYDDTPLPIGAGQTISQPYIVAFMIEALRLTPDCTVLEVGTGCGYAAALLSNIAHQVFTIERVAELAAIATTNLAAAGCSNVAVRHGDGTKGWPEQAPFDAILISACAPEPPQTLIDQLVIGGRMVLPVGAQRSTQQLLRLTKISERHTCRDHLTDVRFVPLIGNEGWPT